MIYWWMFDTNNVVTHISQITRKLGGINILLLYRYNGTIELAHYSQFQDWLFVTNERRQKLFAIQIYQHLLQSMQLVLSQMGNALKFYLNLTLSNMGVINNLEVLESSVNSVPEVTTEDKLPEKI